MFQFGLLYYSNWLKKGTFGDALIMLGNRFLICLALFLVFFAGISAQEKITQDEVSIEKLLKLEEFTTLRFLVSTREDVKALFGEECKEYSICNYNNDWSISFEFAGDILYLLNSSKERIGRMDSTFVNPEFKGKLVAINLHNPSYVFPENYSLPPDFDCTEENYVTRCSNGETFIQYFVDRNSRVKRIGISHRVSITQYKQITGETELKRFPPQQSIPPKEPKF